MDWLSDNLSKILIGLLTALVGIASYFVTATISDLKQRPTESQVKVLILEQTTPRFEKIESDVSDFKALILTFKDMKEGIDKIGEGQIKQGKDIAVIKDRLEINN